MITPQIKLTLGSRGSNLALWQTNWVKAELEQRFPNLAIHIEIIKTIGDKILDSPLSKIGDKGLFTREIEHALLDKRIDVAVHSLKDVPTQLPAGLTIGAITKREDVRDVFISHPKKLYKQFDGLPRGANIATGSLRRKCQIMNWRPDINIIDVRGNLNTRFEKLDASDWDGMILARAGVLRLGFSERVSEIFPTNKILPAVGQGALAIEIRDDDAATLRYVRELASEATTIATKAERAFLRFLEGGCQVPIGTFGRVENNIFMLDGMIGSLDGKKILRGTTHSSPEHAETVAIELAKMLFESGGKEILESIRRTSTITSPLI